MQRTVLPLARGGVDDSKQLIVGHSLRVEIDRYRLLLHVLVGSEQRLPDHRLSGAGVADNED